MGHVYAGSVLGDELYYGPHVRAGLAASGAAPRTLARFVYIANIAYILRDVRGVVWACVWSLGVALG